MGSDGFQDKPLLVNRAEAWAPGTFTHGLLTGSDGFLSMPPPESGYLVKGFLEFERVPRWVPSGFKTRHSYGFGRVPLWPLDDAQIYIYDVIRRRFGSSFTAWFLLASRTHN